MFTVSQTSTFCCCPSSLPYLLITNDAVVPFRSLTAALGFALGDVIAQHATKYPGQKYDYWRTARMTTFGIAFAGPLQGHYWYRWLDKVSTRSESMPRQPIAVLGAGHLSLACILCCAEAIICDCRHCSSDVTLLVFADHLTKQAKEVRTCSQQISGFCALNVTVHIVSCSVHGKLVSKDGGGLDRRCNAVQHGSDCVQNLCGPVSHGTSGNSCILFGHEDHGAEASGDPACPEGQSPCQSCISCYLTS